MTSFYIGQIEQFAFDFAPRFWALCAGQLLPISQNAALFSLLGTQYGGNGQTTFALPNLQGRSPIGWGTGPGLDSIQIGQSAGTENVTLLTSNLPAHNHTASFNGSSSTLSTSNVRSTLQSATAGALLGRTADTVAGGVPLIYAPSGTATSVALGGLNVAGTVTTGATGGGQPVGIRSPYLGINFSIAISGIFPSRN